MATWRKRIFPYLKVAGEQSRRDEEARSLHFMRAWWTRYLSISRNIVVKMLKKDREDFLEHLAQLAVNCDIPSKKAEFYQKIKIFRGATARRKPHLMVQPSPSMEGDEGFMCSSHEERQLTLQRHFAEQEAAEIGTIDEGLRRCAKRQQQRAIRGELPQLRLEVPTLQMLENA